MGPLTTSLIVLAILFGGSILGMFLHSYLPENHLNEDSKRVVTLGAGVIATMAALVLGLLVASAKSTFDTQNNEVLDVSAKIALLDRILAMYGPEASSTRNEMRDAVGHTINRLWPRDGSGRGRRDPAPGAEAIFGMIQSLTPENDTQRNLKNQALTIGMNLAQTRWLLYAQDESYVSMPLVVVVVFWVTINFVSFGLFAPRNATVIGTFFLCAVAVAGAIFLILQMYRPFEGLIHISDAPMRNVLAQMGR